MYKGLLLAKKFNVVYRHLLPSKQNNVLEYRYYLLYHDLYMLFLKRLINNVNDYLKGDCFSWIIKTLISLSKRHQISCF